MKRVAEIIGVSLVAVTLVGCSFAQVGDNTGKSAAQTVEDPDTVQAFLDEAVPDADVTAIVNAGVNAPSSMNGQPWHFSVITNKDTLEEINGSMGMGFAPPKDGDFPGKPDGDMPNMPDGDMPAPPEANSSGPKAGMSDAPLVIVVSCKPGSDLDAGLATENMAAEAALLGYGTKIVSSPTMALNGEKQDEYRQKLGIPEDMSAVCVLLVGKTDTANFDAVTSATPRNSVEEVVTYIK